MGRGGISGGQKAWDRWVYLGAGHAPLGGAVHEGGEGEAVGALPVPLPEELLLQLHCPPLVCARPCRQVPYVRTLQHHLHAHTRFTVNSLAAPTGCMPSSNQCKELCHGPLHVPSALRLDFSNVCWLPSCSRPGWTMQACMEIPSHNAQLSHG